MAGINIRNLTNITAIEDNDYVIVEQVTGTKKATIADITKSSTSVHHSEPSGIIEIQKPEMVEKINNMETAITQVSSQLEQKANKKELSYVNVKLYGAKGDGFTDDTQAIKKALSENNNILFPKGTYIISEVITLNKSTNIIGDGQTLNWGIKASDCSIIKGTHDDYIFKCNWENQNNFHKINFNGKGIYNPCSSFIEECGFTGKIGIYHSRVTTIDRCVFSSCSEYGIYKTVDSKIINSFFFANGIGIYGYDSNDNIIRGNKIEWNNTGIKLDINVYNLISNNIFDRNTTYGIETVNGSQLSILNNQFERNLINHIKITNNNFTINGNSFYQKNSEDDLSGTLVPSDAINLKSVSNGIITGNIIEGGKMFYSLYDSFSKVTIKNNLINGVYDTSMWVNLGNITLEPSAEGELRYRWESLNYLGANGWSVIVSNLRTEEGESVYYNNCSCYNHKNNGLYVKVKNNSTTSQKTYTVYAEFIHTGWNLR